MLLICIIVRFFISNASTYLANIQSFRPLSKQISQNLPALVSDGAEHLVSLVGPVARLHKLDPAAESGLRT